MKKMIHLTCIEVRHSNVHQKAEKQSPDIVTNRVVDRLCQALSSPDLISDAPSLGFPHQPMVIISPRSMGLDYLIEIRRGEE